MKKFIIASILLIAGLPAHAKNDDLPSVFQGFTWNSKVTIAYDDLDAVLKASVLDAGMSDRSSIKGSTANIGTRMRSHKNTDTALEANRFMFEALKNSPLKAAFIKIRQSLEAVPSQMPLSDLKNEEQLAYWLNLYNVALLEKLIAQYPIYNMEDELTGKNSLLNEKFLNVAGHALSLNDIQHNIVYKKFGDKPVVIYGFYQGNIGSPSLNPEAYKGEQVYRQLEKRATEFVNSNRGAVAAKRNTLKVSRFYEQTRDLFTHFESDLKKHIATYAEGALIYQAKQAKRIKTDIEDWNITDIYGTSRTFGGGVATNSAAMLNAVVGNDTHKSSHEGELNALNANNLGGLSEKIASFGVDFGRFSPEQAKLLQKLKEKHEHSQGTVEIKDKTSQKQSDNH